MLKASKARLGNGLSTTMQFQESRTIVQRQIPWGSRAWPRVESSNPRRPYKSTSAEGMEDNSPAWP